MKSRAPWFTGLASTLIALVAPLASLGPACAPEDISPPTEITRLHIDRDDMRDEHGRYVLLNGINVSGTTKVPVTTAPISYVGRPFPLDEADHWFARLKADGFNSVRLLTIWEAVCPDAPGVYDEAYLDFFEALVRIAGEHGLYVLVNFHENMFSRFLYSSFTEQPEFGAPGSIEAMLATLFPKTDPDGGLSYDGRIIGDGAPRWAVEACLPEKDLDAPTFGMARIIGPLGDPDNLGKVVSSVSQLLGGLGVSTEGADGSDESLVDFLQDRIGELLAHDLLPFDMTQTSDMLPFTAWFTNVGLSLDIEKCYAAFFAGDRVFPSRRVDGKNVKDYLQEGFIAAWIEVVKRVKRYPNVIGYDLMNEPTSVYVVMTLLSAYISAGFDTAAAKTALASLVGPEFTQNLFDAIEALEVLPLPPGALMPDAVAETLTEPIAAGVALALGAALAELADTLPVADIDAEPLATPRAAALDAAVAAAQAKTAAAVQQLDAKAYDHLDADGRAALDALVAQSVGAGLVAGLEHLNGLLAALGPDPPTDDQRVMALWMSTPLAEAAAGEMLDAGMEDVRRAMLTSYWDSIKQEWGLEDFDAFASLDLTTNFPRGYLLPYYERLGTAILAEDPDAILHFETAINVISMVLPAQLPLADGMYRPDSLPNVVHNPHWYPDIYPFIGLNTGPREFHDQQWETRDFRPDIAKLLEEGRATMGGIPAVVGEFGTYFNYNWDVHDPQAIAADIAENDYQVSARILSKYYEAFDALLCHRMVWCFSADNDHQKGDLWNHEDFSLYGPDGLPRAARGWMRPVPRFVAGEPKELRFLGDLHYYDPDKGQPEAWQRHEFFLAYESKESEAPTEIYVPDLQYPDGFYVWLSDGWALYDHAAQTLYHYPTRDEPDWTHEVTIRPPAAGHAMDGWSYFFRGDAMVTGDRR